MHVGMLAMAVFTTMFFHEVHYTFGKEGTEIPFTDTGRRRCYYSSSDSCNTVVTTSYSRGSYNRFA